LFTLMLPTAVLKEKKFQWQGLNKMSKILR